MPEPDTMIYWLAEAAKRARLAAGRMHVHIAASMNRDQSTVYRFEHGAWPRNPDETVAAYADDLDIKPIDLWTEALRLWQEGGDVVPLDATPTRGGGPGSLPQPDDDVVPQLPDERPKPKTPARRRSTGAKGRRRSA